MGNELSYDHVTLEVYLTALPKPKGILNTTKLVFRLEEKLLVLAMEDSYIK